MRSVSLGLSFCGVLLFASSTRADDDLLYEVVQTLNASAYLPPDLTRLLDDGLAALKQHDRCLQVKKSEGSVAMSCSGRTAAGVYPPPSAKSVIATLESAVEIVTPPDTDRGPRRAFLARALAASLKDPWTAYLDPVLVARLDAHLATNRATAGIELTPRDPARVREVRPGSAAHQEGLEAGDRIMMVDGQPVAGWTLPELGASLIGARGSVARLEVRTVDGARKKLFVRRDVLPEKEYVLSENLENGVLYLRITQFGRKVAREVQAKVWDGSYTAVVLDLRHNPGGLIQEGVALLDVFFSEGNIGAVQPRKGRPSQDYTASAAPTDSGLPLAVLIDGGTASASEFVSLVLKERKRAIILGTPSLGKGSVQKPIRMPGRGLLKVTSAKYLGPSGNVLPAGGVTPNRLLGPARGRTVLEGGSAAKDSWVLAALDALEGVSGRFAGTPGSRFGPAP